MLTLAIVKNTLHRYRRVLAQLGHLRIWKHLYQLWRRLLLHLWGRVRSITRPEILYWYVFTRQWRHTSCDIRCMALWDRFYIRHKYQLLFVTIKKMLVKYSWSPSLLWRFKIKLLKRRGLLWQFKIKLLKSRERFLWKPLYVAWPIVNRGKWLRNPVNIKEPNDRLRFLLEGP